MKIIAMMLLGAGPILAQAPADNTVTTTAPASTSTTTTTTVPAPTPGPNEMSGTIISYDPTALNLVVSTPNSTAPITYIVNSLTAFVNEANKSIPGTLLTKGSPVTVYFEATGNLYTAKKVILRKLIHPDS